MNLINKALIKSIQILPKSVVKIFSKRYVAGISNTEALQTIQQLNLTKQSATIDILGEHTNVKKDCEKITEEYIEILHKIKNNNLDCNVSIKPTHIGADINYSTVLNNFKNILMEASKLKNFLRIDMESSELTDTTIKLYNDLYQISNNIGIVLQAYLYRTEDDIKNLKKGSNIRLCKGIYKESKSIAYQEYNQINTNFIKILKIAFEKNIYVGIATHDKNLINLCFELINSMNIKSNQFEFQYLHGVPMKNMIKKYKRMNYKVRVYVPFGQNWYDYSIRRIKENPKIASYIIKNIFSTNR